MLLGMLFITVNLHSDSTCVNIVPNNIGSKIKYQLLGIGLLVSVATGCSKAQQSAKANGSPPTPVELRTLQKNTLENSTEFVGTLQAEQTVELKPQTDGRIEQILVEPGDQVKQGQRLFILNPDQTKPQLNSAQANVNSYVAARNSAVQQLRVAESQLASAQSQSELARLNNQRNQYLVGQGAVAQSQADQTATTLRVQADAVRTAQAQISSAKAALNQANANVRKAQADAATARINFNFKQVNAPISGAVGNFTLKVGNYVTTGQTLTFINQNNFFDLQIPIPLSNSGQLRTGLPVQLLDPNTGNQLGSGNIYFVSSQTDSTNQTIATRARFSNAGNKLRNAQYVKARVIWQTKPGILVPIEAVTMIGGQGFVFVAADKTQNGKNQPIVHQVPVTLGNIQGQSYQVVRGLKPGDNVVVSQTTKLKDGASITPQADKTSSSLKS